MNLIRDRIFLGFLACILFLYLSFFLFQLDIKGEDNFALINSYLLIYNSVIAASLIAFGWIGGIISLVLTLLILLFLSASAGSLFYWIHGVPNLLTIILFLGRTRALSAFQTEFILKSEKITENRNTLSEKLDKESAQAEALELKSKRYEALKNVAEYLSDIFSLEKISRFLTERSYEIVGKSTRSLLYLVDHDTHELVLIYTRQPGGFPKVKAKKGDIFDRWVLRQNQPLIVLDAAKDFRFGQDKVSSKNINFKSLIAVPMVSHNKMIGLLRLDSQKADIYNPDDLRLLDIIGDLGAVSLHNNMLYQRTTELAIKDGLTQLFVHSYFLERLEKELARALKKKHPLSLLMIDIDHFKDYNDKYGHIAGDILLKNLGSIFLSIVGKGDVVARYGGEEFSITLYGQDKAGAGKIAEKIRKTIEERVFYLRREETHATVSIGISTLANNARTGQDLLRIADENLYCAKRKGRNKVCTG